MHPTSSASSIASTPSRNSLLIPLGMKHPPIPDIDEETFTLLSSGKKIPPFVDLEDDTGDLEIATDVSQDDFSGFIGKQSPLPPFHGRDIPLRDCHRQWY